MNETPKSCSVCGLSDARALTETRLANGTRAIVCGTHALVHQRVNSTAGDASELRELTQDRRYAERRGTNDLSADALSAELASAFNAGRRKDGDRREI